MAVTASELEEFPDKLQRLAEIAEGREVKTLVLRQQASLSWLFGARSHVPYTLDRSWFDAVVDVSTTIPRVTIVSNTIETPRLKDTELAGFPLDWATCGWWCSREKLLPRGPSVACDSAIEGMIDLSAEVARVRRTLTKGQQSTLREVCADSALIASSLAAEITPTMSETHVAGLIAAALLDREMDPVTVLVAGGSRAGRHRHPLPTSAPLGDRGMLVFCGRRSGLISAVTRIVSFRPLDDEQRDTYERLLGVEAEFLDATRAGSRIGYAFGRGIAGYEKCGFAPDEWHFHHQGGFSGWESREYPASIESTDVVDVGSVVAWNPSAAGWKVEDTALVTANEPELLVRDPLWPMKTVRGRLRPQVLEL